MSRLTKSQSVKAKIGDHPPRYSDKSHLIAGKPFDLHHTVALAIEEFLTLRDVTE